MSLFKRKKKEPELPVLCSMEQIGQEEKPESRETEFIAPFCAVIGEVAEPQVKKPGYITVDRDEMEHHQFTFKEIKKED